MDLTQARTLLMKLQTIPLLPSVKIIDTGDEGVILCLKKTLVNPNTFKLVEDFVNQHSLSLTDSKGYYIIRESLQRKLSQL